MSDMQPLFGDHHGLDPCRIENGVGLFPFGTGNYLYFLSTCFPHNGAQVPTWCPPSSEQRWIQIDHISSRYRWRVYFVCDYLCFAVEPASWALHLIVLSTKIFGDFDTRFVPCVTRVLVEQAQLGFEPTTSEKSIALSLGLSTPQSMQWICVELPILLRVLVMSQIIAGVCKLFLVLQRLQTYASDADRRIKTDTNSHNGRI